MRSLTARPCEEAQGRRRNPEQSPVRIWIASLRSQGRLKPLRLHGVEMVDDFIDMHDIGIFVMQIEEIDLVAQH
jgi:hypothetical protein